MGCSGPRSVIYPLPRRTRSLVNAASAAFDMSKRKIRALSSPGDLKNETEYIRVRFGKIVFRGEFGLGRHATSHRSLLS
jgi:hypothetical protein